jgi:hypothetical protein
MKTYALVNKSGEIVGRTLWDGVSAWSPGDGLTALEETTPMAIGGKVVGGGYVAPETPAPTLPPPRVLLQKSVIIDRLQEAGLLEKAYSVLNEQDLYTQQRWLVRDAVYVDDPTLVGLLKNLGANTDVILAKP